MADEGECNNFPGAPTVNTRKRHGHLFRSFTNMLGNLIKSWKAVNLYIDALARYGIDSSMLHNDVVSRVCNVVCDSQSSHKNGQANTLEWEIQRSAAIVALCVIGPERFKSFTRERHGVSMETIENAATAFRQGGGAATAMDLRLIFIVASVGAMCAEFAGAFGKLLRS